MFEVFGVLALTIVAPIWILSHYITQWKLAKGLSKDEAQLLEELWKIAQRMEEESMTVNRHHFRATKATDRLGRNRRDAMLFGVCAGIANFFTLDPTIVRISALLLLWIFTLPSLVLYLLLAVLAESR